MYVQGKKGVTNHQMNFSFVLHKLVAQTCRTVMQQTKDTSDVRSWAVVVRTQV